MKLPNDKGRCEGQIIPHDDFGVPAYCQYRDDCERYKQRFEGGPNTSVSMMLCEDGEMIIKSEI